MFMILFIKIAILSTIIFNIIQKKTIFSNIDNNINFWELFNNTSFDIVIPVSQNSFIPFSLGVNYFKRMTKFLKNKIVIICLKNLFNDITKICRECELINEDEMYENLTLKNIKKLLSFNKNRAGWYFQQFLKMAYHNISKNDYYLVWDSDTIPLNNFSFFNPANNKPFFTMKKEYNKPYFNTLKIILGLKKKILTSFISEHMIINRYIMEEMINKIEMNKYLKGNTFFEKIIISINPNNIRKSGFSEFETYGTYVYQYYRKEYEYRNLRTCRSGYYYIGFNFRKEISNWVSRSFDIVSFEVKKGKNDRIIDLVMNKNIRKTYEFKDIIAKFKNSYF